jgi:hypothetical protein
VSGLPAGVITGYHVSWEIVVADTEALCQAFCVEAGSGGKGYFAGCLDVRPYVPASPSRRDRHTMLCNAPHSTMSPSVMSTHPSDASKSVRSTSDPVHPTGRHWPRALLSASGCTLRARVKPCHRLALDISSDRSSAADALAGRNAEIAARANQQPPVG